MKKQIYEKIKRNKIIGNKQFSQVKHYVDFTICVWDKNKDKKDIESELVIYPYISVVLGVCPVITLEDQKKKKKKMIMII